MIKLTFVHVWFLLLSISHISSLLFVYLWFKVRLTHTTNHAPSPGTMGAPLFEKDLLITTGSSSLRVVAFIGLIPSTILIYHPDKIMLSFIFCQESGIPPIITLSSLVFMFLRFGVYLNQPPCSEICPYLRRDFFFKKGKIETL